MVEFVVGWRIGVASVAGQKALGTLSFVFDSSAVTVAQKALGTLAVAARDILASLGYWPAQTTT